LERKKAGSVWVSSEQAAAQMMTANKERRQKNAEWEVDFVCILFGFWLGGQSTPKAVDAGWGAAKAEAAPVSDEVAELVAVLH
jgi:hypothetical protein